MAMLCILCFVSKMTAILTAVIVYGINAKTEKLAYCIPFPYFNSGSCVFILLSY